MWESLDGLVVANNASRLANIWILVVPHIALLFRTVSIYQFACILLFVSSATTLVFCTYLLAAQAFCISRGQTRVEYLMDVQAFNVGRWENWKLVMGKQWYFALISPLLPNQLESDGISFRVKEGVLIHESVKSI